MIKKILTTITFILMLQIVSGQCFYDRSEDADQVVFVSRKTKIHDIKRSTVNEVYLYFEKHLSKESTPFVYYGIVLRIHGTYEANEFSLLQLTFFDGSVTNLYLPKEYDKRLYGGFMTYETAGLFEPKSPEVEKIKTNGIKSAILINVDNKYITLQIPPAFFIDALNCVKNLN